jgi:hypothetical protein
MAQAGTLLSDLDGGGGGGGGSGADGDLVQKILADMSLPNQRGPPPPPPMPQQTPQSYAQTAHTMAPMTMDSRIPTTHMIGNEHPTPADFAAAMHGMNAQHMQHGAPVGMMPGAQGIQVAAAAPPSKNFYGRVLDEIKIPITVAILFFVFSLTPIRVLLAHYIPSLIKPTGDLTIVGLGGIALVVGLTFWILHRVIAPLLSL